MTTTRTRPAQTISVSPKKQHLSSGIWVALTALMLSFASVTTAAEIQVNLDPPPSDGAVVLMLFDSANTFGDFRDPCNKAIFPADGRSSFKLENIPPGEYALVVHHDIDNNGVLDKSFIGIPTEPLAFSNKYQPKGPPRYQRALFTLAEGQTAVMDLGFYRALGRSGRIGVGVGVIGRGSPYRDYRGEVTQFIPAVTYNGERIQVLGPFVQVGIAGTGKLRLAALASYRIGVYEEDDSPYLSGMGDRKSTLMAGLGLQYELPKGFDIALRFEADVLDRIGGTSAQFRIDKSFQTGVFRLAPHLGVNWQSSGLSNYDFGVTADQALPYRPVYKLGDQFSFEAGIGSSVELTRDWQLFVSAAIEFFDDEVSNSPIVVEDHILKGFFALNYVF